MIQPNFQDAFQWQKPPNDDRLGISMRGLIDQLNQAVKTEAFQQAWNNVHTLAELARKRLRGDVSAYILVNCAYAAFQMGECQKAIELLDHAIQGYTLYPHNLAALHWMRGYALWLIPGHQMDAILAWQESLDQFDGVLRTQHHSEDELQWYKAQLTEMRSALQDAMSNQGRNVTPPPKPAAATPSTPNTSRTVYPPTKKYVPPAKLRLFRVMGSIPAGPPGPVILDASTENAFVELDMVLIDDKPYHIFGLRSGSLVSLLADKKRVVVKVSGDSMNDCKTLQINDGDYILLNPQMQARSNDIVAAEIVNIDRAATLKRYVEGHNGKKIALKAESTNPAFKDKEWELGPYVFYIRGVAVAVFKPL